MRIGILLRELEPCICLAYGKAILNPINALESIGLCPNPCRFFQLLGILIG